MHEANAETVLLDAAPPDGVPPEVAGALLWDTDPHIFGVLHGGDAALGHRHLGHQWLQPAGLFSHAHARAAMLGDRMVGLSLGFDAATMAAEAGPFVAAAQAYLSEAEFGQLASWFEHGPFVMPAVPDDTWYLQNLAVLPEGRGRGIGERLLTDCFEQARAAGHARVHLDLYDGNPAQRLYERAGMQVIVETRVPPLVARGVGLHLRMEIRL